MKKKLLYVLLTVAALSIAGCGKEEPKHDPIRVPDDEYEQIESDEEEDEETEEADTEDSENAEVVTDDEDETPDEVFEADTIGQGYQLVFEGTTETDCNAVVDELIDKIDIDLELVKMEVTPGYLNGFTKEISGFNEGVMFSPMIGSIPFVGYVFTSDDPEALEAQLLDSADLRWNVCTEADEMVSSINGNLVFFMMCLNE